MRSGIAHGIATHRGSGGVGAAEPYAGAATHGGASARSHRSVREVSAAARSHGATFRTPPVAPSSQGGVIAAIGRMGLHRPRPDAVAPGLLAEPLAGNNAAGTGTGGGGGAGQGAGQTSAAAANGTGAHAAQAPGKPSAGWQLRGKGALVAMEGLGSRGASAMAGPDHALRQGAGQAGSAASTSLTVPEAVRTQLEAAAAAAAKDRGAARAVAAEAAAAAGAIPAASLAAAGGMGRPAGAGGLSGRIPSSGRPFSPVGMASKTASRQASLASARGILPAAQAIYAEGGTVAFWRGNGTNVLKIAPETAVRFVAFDWAKRHIAGNPDNVTAPERFVAGAFAGIVSTCTVYPLEIAKTRLALSKAGEVKGIVDCLSTLVKQEGVRAIYRGLGASLLGIVPYSGTELMIFSLLRDGYAARFPDREPGVATLLASGAVASLAGQVVAFPLQLARTRLQAQGLPGRETVRYNGLAHCLRSVVMRDGFRGLYRGMLPGFMKSIPSCMISFAVFERAKATLRPYANRAALDQQA